MRLTPCLDGLDIPERCMEAIRNMAKTAKSHESPKKLLQWAVNVN